MDGKYVRIQTRYCGKTGKPIGIFAACWHLMEGVMREDALSEEDKEIYLNIRNWFEENLPNPPYYEDGNTIKAITWFKKDNSNEMLVFRYGGGESMNIKALFLDFYGTLVYEDGEVISRICQKIRKASPYCAETREIATYWWEKFFSYVLKVMMKISGFKGILS